MLRNLGNGLRLRIQFFSRGLGSSGHGLLPRNRTKQRPLDMFFGASKASVLHAGLG